MADHYIEFRDVSKSFDDHLVLDHVSFFVDPGETCVIMGRSGVGKSVTLKHIMGFLKPDEGRVIVAGEDITDLPEDRLRQIRRRVTMVFQSGALFDSLSVAENIAFPLTDGVGFDNDEIEARVAELAQMLEVTKTSTNFPPSSALGPSAPWPSPAPWRWIPKPSSTTSPPRWSIRSWPRTPAT